MKALKDLDKESLIDYIKKAIKLLCEKSVSEVVVLSSYKINSVLKENFGIDIKVDKLGRVLSKIAKRNHLKRLNTKIPKYKLNVCNFTSLKFF